MFLWTPGKIYMIKTQPFCNQWFPLLASNVQTFTMKSNTQQSSTIELSRIRGDKTRYFAIYCNLQIYSQRLYGLEKTCNFKAFSRNATPIPFSAEWTKARITIIDRFVFFYRIERRQEFLPGFFLNKWVMIIRTPGERTRKIISNPTQHILQPCYNAFIKFSIKTVSTQSHSFCWTKLE